MWEAPSTLGVEVKEADVEVAGLIEDVRAF
jgi:hypothetical protein